MIGIGSSNDAPLQQRGKVIAIEMGAVANADGLAKRPSPRASTARGRRVDPAEDIGDEEILRRGDTDEDIEKKRLACTTRSASLREPTNGWWI